MEDLRTLPAWLTNHRPKFQGGYRICIIVSALVLVLIFALWPPSHSRLSAVGAPSQQQTKVPEAPQVSKPAHPKIKVVGLVFYGRRDRVEILNCYLKKNLVKNGGMFDEVQFAINTDKKDDLKWLEDNLAGEEGYVMLKQDRKDFTGWDYSKAYGNLERDVLYIKIDDDIVFIEDGAVKSLVETRLNNPEPLLVSANVINHPLLTWVHYHLGALRPYLPELKQSQSPSDSPSWRASELPDWDGPKDFKIEPEIDFKAPYKGHRWLPVRKERATTDHTPIEMTEYDPGGKTLKKWPVAAQEHYSFLEHLESDPGLKQYRFPLWDVLYARSSINMIAFMGNDILDNLPIPNDDEWFFTTQLSAKLGRHNVVDGDAIAVHFSYGPQKAGLESTDLLARYKAYADENVCGKY